MAYGNDLYRDENGMISRSIVRIVAIGGVVDFEGGQNLDKFILNYFIKLRM